MYGSYYITEFHEMKWKNRQKDVLCRKIIERSLPPYWQVHGMTEKKVVLQKAADVMKNHHICR